MDFVNTQRDEIKKQKIAEADKVLFVSIVGMVAERFRWWKMKDFSVKDWVEIV